MPSIRDLKALKHRLLNYLMPLTYCMAIAFIMLLFFIYFTYPSEALLYISLGLSLLVIDALFVIVKLKKPVISRGLNNQSQIINIDSFLQEQQFAQHSKQYYAQLSNHTTLLSTNEGNPAASEEEFAAVSPTGAAVLEFAAGGQNRHVDVEHSPFLLGREPALVDHYVEALGISRLHCELICTGDKWGIKDLGSSNGTFVNDERLVPYKWTELEDGDRITMIGFSAVFRHLHSPYNRQISLGQSSQ